jgi:cysteinyl-tRNA synthetase
MSLDLLGDRFDIHGGGIDLAFPHHENERAQAVATGRAFAHHWVHNGFVMMGGEKMSKSLGNFTSLTDLLERTDGRAYRLLLLRSHYRSPVEVTPDTVADAEEALVGLDALVRRFGLSESVVTDPTAEGALALGADPDAVRAFMATMDADLGTPAALGALFELARRANVAGDGGDQDEGRRLALTVLVLCAALGLTLHGRPALDPATQALVAERDAARAARDFARADAIRQQLEADGWHVEDGPHGGELHR